MDVPTQKTTDETEYNLLNESYKAYVSPTTVEKELKTAKEAPFRTKVKLSGMAKDRVHEQFLEVLEQNPEYIDSILELGKFQAVSHWCSECPNPDHGFNQCDNCHSGDTDCEMKAEATEVLAKLWKETFEFMGDDDEADEDEDEDSNDEDNEKLDNEEASDVVIPKNSTRDIKVGRQEGLCGVEFKKGSKINLYCTAVATKDGACGFRTCSIHVNRRTRDI